MLPFFSALAAAAAAALPPCADASWLAVIGGGWLCNEGAAVAGRILLFPAVGESVFRCAQTVAGSDLDVMEPGGRGEPAAKSVLDPGRGAVDGRRFGRADIAKGTPPRGEGMAGSLIAAGKEEGEGESCCLAGSAPGKVPEEDRTALAKDVLMPCEGLPGTARALE